MLAQCSAKCMNYAARSVRVCDISELSLVHRYQCNLIIIICCVGVVYSGECDVGDVTLSLYPHRASFKNMPGHGGDRTYELVNYNAIIYFVSKIRIRASSEI